MRLKTTILLLSLSVWLPNLSKAQETTIKAEISKEAKQYRDTTIVKYWPNGLPKKQESFDSEGLLTGPSFSFRQSGSITKMETYFKGRLHGPMLKVNNRGKIKEEASYVNGEVDGLVMKYYGDGKKQEQSNYKMGIKDGKSIWYYTNGNMSTMLSYSDNNLQG
ncbi:MAG: toxin-antitoxin system YwqK family antitoxin, partial [Croceimicrobium sp.]